MDLRALGFVAAAGVMCGFQIKCVQADETSSTPSGAINSTSAGPSPTNNPHRNSNAIRADRDAIHQDRTNTRNDQSAIEKNRQDVRAAERDIQISPQNKSVDQARIAADQQSIKSDRKDLAKNEHHLRHDHHDLRANINQWRQQRPPGNNAATVKGSVSNNGSLASSSVSTQAKGETHHSYHQHHSHHAR